MRLCLLLALVTTMACAQPAHVPVDQELSELEVLKLVNPQYPGLADFTAAMQANDLPAARQALLKHFATRTQPVIPPAAAAGVSEGNSMCVLSKTSPEQAEKWLQHTFTLSNNDAGKQETYDLGPEIKWTVNPSAALSWILYLNQLNHLNSLAGLYAQNKDEKLAQKIGQSVLTWSHQCPRGYGYINNGELVKSGMEVRNRLCNLLVTYDVVRASPSLTPEMHLAFWKVFIASARELMTYEGVSYPGLIPLAVMYPEFTESTTWLKSGDENLRFCLVNRTSPEGAWDTQSISYQTVSVPWSLRSLEFLQANPGSGEFGEMAAMVKQQVGKLLGLMLWISMPNGGLPNVGDTYGRGDWADGNMRSYLTSLIQSQMTPEQQAALNAITNPYGRLKAALALTEGTGGAAPQATSLGFPGSGYYVMRSGWDPLQARCLYFDLTPQAMGHAHNDALHFDLFAYGKPLLADAGDYFLGWGYRAALHNTIEVDDQDQARGAAAAPMIPHEWLSTAAFDFADMAHGAYEARGVTHRRKLIFVKPDYWILTDLLTGEGSHKLEQFFHFAGATQTSAAQATLDPNSLAARSQNQDVANIQVLPAHTEGLSAAFAEAQDTNMKIEDKYERAAMLGWMVTGGTFQRVKAPVAVYTREGALPQAFHDVLYPTPPGAQADLKVSTLPVTRDGKPVPPTEAACLVIEGKLTTRKHEPGTLVPDLGPNLAQGKPATAEINQGDIAATSPLLTDGDLSAEKIPGAVSSGPYTPNVLLTGRFTVDLGQPAEVNAVVLHHGTWNGSQILYPAEKLAVQYWDGEKWADAPEQQTTWRTASISETFFRPTTASRLSVAVERPSGGRLALREFEAFRVPQAELDRVAAMRAETVTESFRDVCLISNSPDRRRYGDYWFDGDFALIRHDAQGQVKQLLLKNATFLTNERDLNFETHVSRRYYCNLSLADDGTATVETPYAGEMDLKVNNREPRLLGTDGKPYDTEHDVTQGEFSDLKAVLEPAQPGFAGAQPSALVTWRTEKPAMSQVHFGENEVFDRCTPLDRRLTTDHAVRVYFLRPDRKYSFKVYGTDGLLSVTCEAGP